MSYNLESSIATIEAYPDIRSKLIQIKSIGYRSGLSKMSEYTTLRLRELKLVTSAFTRPVPLDINSGDIRDGSRIISMALVRYIKAKVPVLASLGSNVLYTRNGSLIIKVDDSPAVNKYVNLCSRKLSEATMGTAIISISRGICSLHITKVINRQADSYRILKYLPEIIKGLETLTREVVFERISVDTSCVELMELDPEPEELIVNANESGISNEVILNAMDQLLRDIE